MSNVNLAVKSHTQDYNAKFITINSAPSYAARLFNSSYLSSLIWSLVKLLHTIYCLIYLLIVSFTNIYGSFYRPINGGFGLIYDVFYLLVARIFLNKIFIHHHSFNYLNKKSTLFFLVNKVAGKSATHVVLGTKMKLLLSERYGIDESCIIEVSNLALFKPVSLKALQNSVIQLGHLANLCEAKGTFTFIEVCKKLSIRNIEFKAKLAGPFVDDETKKLVVHAIKEIPQLEYLGPLFNQDKDAFYQTLDCFIFPSSYQNEAEPLVLYEAASAGALLIGTEQGCMKAVINNLNGYSFNGENDIAENIVSCLISAKVSRLFTNNAKQERIEQFNQLLDKSKIQLHSLLRKMISINH
ncbi:glycosyltransferase family 4 protein [Colwellia sp. MEBiC06753]